MRGPGAPAWAGSGGQSSVDWFHLVTNTKTKLLFVARWQQVCTGKLQRAAPGKGLVKSSLSYDGGAQRTTWSGHCEVVRKKIGLKYRSIQKGAVWTRRTDSPSSPPPSSVSPSLFCTHSRRAGVKGQTVNGLRSRTSGLRLTWTFCSRRWQLLWSAGFVGNRWPWHRASGRPRTTWLKERARERKSFSWLRIINNMDGKIWKHLEMWGVIDDDSTQKGRRHKTTQEWKEQT